MAVRWRKYFKECKITKCGGRKGKYCPTLPHRANGDYKACGVWLVEMFNESKNWVSLSFADVKNRRDAERRLSLFVADRERGRLNLPKKKHIPTLAEYVKTYLDLQKGIAENTLLMKQRGTALLVKYLGGYPLDKITPFLVEKFRLERREKDGVKDSSINIDVQVLSHLFNTAINAGIVEKNPCKTVKKLKTAQYRDRILSGQEIALLFDKLTGKESIMVRVGLFTGMRLNEVLKLRWGNIDFVKRLITFTQSKTGKLVVMPFSNTMADALLRYRAAFTGFCEDTPMFELQEITHKVVSAYSSKLKHYSGS